ncbi:PD-(D/E)XK nuclease family protein [Bifidobacterium pullorum subsp. saeculare]|uniref:PD-(D/E)XK nuclease family protein n=1 Tax=Bifidobacterium pullorum TaxID=78448 RepID=UPI00195ADF9A|nr:PD-(D/E)XK nuclease family protein [Bifidobacterium pullorum]MBM6706721.1 PD-(D/E)XK nuclease family protein [Bifidobacterium pullorum subsp. saeculare]
MNGNDDVRAALDELMDGVGEHALLVAGAPGCGKTAFAYDALVQGLHRFGDAQAMMTVSGRVLADRLGNRVIREIGVSSKARPVTTLSAAAFGVISSARAASGEPAPRLLNGAEQDALLRRVTAVHLRHAASGDLCGTCMLLREYFASDGWADTLVAGQDTAAQAAGPEGTDGESSLALFERGVSSAFIDQLRDMLARINELGASFSGEERLIGLLHDSARQTERLELQWRLAFALRHEYVSAIERDYPGEYRLDASRLLVEAASVLTPAADIGDGVRATLPELMVVDDFQDTTLAGLRFLEALQAVGVRLVLVGNPDEAVQTFRGSYPEYLFQQAQRGALRADPLSLPSQIRHTYGETVAARVSLSIPSTEDDTVPLPARPGKMPPCDGALPIAPLPEGSPLPDDGTVHTALYRSPREELDDVVWRIKRRHLDDGVEWNDMAVIAHDNATVRTFGERLRRDGVPVRYSSVTRPLKDEPFVQGLFALIELARLRRTGASAMRMGTGTAAAYVRSRVVSLMGSPLITAGARPGEGRAARLEPVESAMTALVSLSSIVADGIVADDGNGAEDGTDENGVDGAVAAARDSAAARGEEPASYTGGGLVRLAGSWARLREKMDLAHTGFRDGGGTDSVEIDDRLVDPDANPGEDDVPLSLDALYVMLAFDDAAAPASDVLDAVAGVLGSDPQSKAFSRLWRLVGKVAEGLGRLTFDEPQFVLSLAWDATGVAAVWQRAALMNTPEGRAANDRLDVAMRLFQFAEGTVSGHDVESFIAQVRLMEIEADSLAHVSPVEQAVTLTTPAGAAGRRWRFVWLPAVQRDVWPNLTERGTLFGGEDLADVMLHGRLPETTGVGRDPRLSAVLSGEKKSLLVALTRADDAVDVSAVWNDDVTPSDFLYGYMPERFVRNRERAAFTRVGHAGGDESDDLDALGLDADPRGLVTAARVTLIRNAPDSPRGRDAASALALLAEHGVSSADPDNWNFMATDSSASGAGPASEALEPNDADAGDTVVTLSPSAVDGIWACPVCWALENRCAGPRPASVYTSFGTLIHEVARLGSEEGLDLPSFMKDADDAARLEAVVGRLRELYDELRGVGPSGVDDARRRYIAARKDQTVATVLGNIASYFVHGRDDGYLGGNAKNFSVGSLERAECEVPFTARFGLRDVLAAYNALPGIEAIGTDELMAMMGELVGGWPEGMREDLTIRLAGRIDRLERRRLADGTSTIRLVDYKTGQSMPARQMANDLQLVCYQLGLAFPEHGERGPAAMDHITQGSLFFVAAKDSPANSYAPESAFQPALFEGGALNDTTYIGRSHYGEATSLLDVPGLPDLPPAGVRGRTWERFLSLRGTQAVWALTMIARVFYAAAASRSARLVAHPTAQHRAHCRMATVCPACSGKIDTVIETRQS